MPFADRCPTIADLLGRDLSKQIDEHGQMLVGCGDDTAVAHSKDCPVADWCSLTNTDYPPYSAQLDLIEWAFAQVKSAAVAGTSPLDTTKFRQAYQQKARNRDQFNQLLAEVAVAATCAQRAILTDLEWRTGKSDYDADVQGDFQGTRVNLEVTLRSDPWFEKCVVHVEDFLDERGELKNGKVPPAKSRSTLTRRQEDDLRESLKDSKGVLPSIEREPDEPMAESKVVQQRITEKARKFHDDGYHVVVVATVRPGFPHKNHVFDALFGAAPQLTAHGLFTDGTYRELCAVVYLPVYQHLRRLHAFAVGNEPVDPKLTAVFPNSFATFALDEHAARVLASAFDADIAGPWS